MAGCCGDTSDDMLDSELQCVICRDTYNDPVELSCGHNFCRQCLLQCVINNQTSYDSYYDNLVGGCDCPICRKKHQLTGKMVEDMQGNLKLRNIIAAVQEKAKKKPTNCFTHKKAYALFCEDCNDTKCLSCFMDTCTKGHKVEEIEVMASNVKEELDAKKEQLQQQKLQLEAHAERSTRIEKDMKFLSEKLSQASLLRTHLMKDTEEEIDDACDQLSSMDKWNIVKLVQSRELISTMEIPTATKSPTVQTIDEAVEEFEKNLSKAIQKLTTTIADNETLVNTLEKKKPQASESSVSCNSQVVAGNSQVVPGNNQVVAGTGYDLPLDSIAQSIGASGLDIYTPYDHNSYSLRFAVVDPFSDMLFPYDLEQLQPPEEESRFRLLTHLPRLMQLNRAAVPPVATFRFRTELIEAVNLVGNRFYLCTNEALHVIVDDNTLTAVQQGSHFTACCAIDELKTLVCFPQMVEVHRNDSLFSRNSIFSIIVHMPVGAKISSVGVSDSEPKLYFISDERRFCIHVWNSQTRMWMHKIRLQNYTEFHRFHTSFKFVVYHDILYVSIFNEGKVIAIDLSGDLVWCNSINVVSPNGVFATSAYLYVCDTSHGIVLLDTTDGSLKGSLLQEETIQSWSIAVNESRLALIDRYHLHNAARSPVRVRMYNLPQLMATYLHAS